MDFSPKQWVAIVVTVAAFVTAALIIRGGSSGNGVADVSYDDVAWCETANALSRWRSVLDGSADGDTEDELLNLRAALDDARSVAPPAIRTDVARLYDFVLLTGQANRRSNGDLTAALADAERNTDQPRVQSAITVVDQAVTACGHPSLRG